MLLLTILIIAILGATIAMIRKSIVRRHLQSKRIIQVFDTHNNHIQLNETVSLTLEESPHEETSDKDTDRYIVSIVADGEVIDSARIDMTLFPFLTNHYPELKFNGPWHKLIVKQYIPFSQQFIQQGKVQKQNRILQDKDTHLHLQEQIKQNS